MSSLPASVLEDFTNEVGKSAEKIALRLGLAMAGFLAAMIAMAFAFAAAYTGLALLVGALAAQLILAGLFAIAAAVLFAFASQVTRRRHRITQSAEGGGPPYDDWAGRMAGSVAYAFAEGLMRGRRKGPEAPTAPSEPGVS